MHDNALPNFEAMQFLSMMNKTIYESCNVGFLKFYIFIILVVFRLVLMVGGTPEFLEKKEKHLI